MSQVTHTACDRCERIIDDADADAVRLVILNGVKAGEILDQFDVDSQKDADLCGKCAARVNKLLGPND